ncbi:DUF2189 domain-containing protein [Thiorhodococcus minor]|uniref:DUF2189 domain-containing protein n=1 Tax=Thiorhodococcus minor TaxID=57489 RepID=A0A6M0JUI5_9GAMM|nr:DUF2189 domain-containing protein [Thiorhodococcus minor]NEV60744.1 DUF2189 domain-containing protein [Thiorhodococcus minor]
MGAHAIHDHQSQGSDLPAIRKVELAEPLDWIGQGAKTFARHPAHSLLYGVVFALACWLTVLLTWSLPWFTVAFLTGLMLAGPFLAAGLYVAARQSGSDSAVSIRESLGLIWERRTNLSLFALFLGLIAAAWVRLSALLFAVQFSAFAPSIQSYQSVLGGTGFDPVVTAFFIGIGFILAAAVFVTSAMAIPLILDRDAGPITAIQASVRAFTRNWPAMILWAAIIVAFSGIGILTFFVGMIVIFPLLGYATWESYKRVLD